MRLSRNFGHQIALTAGVDVARGDAVVVMDADLQDPPEVVLEMAARWREGYDVVYAVRAERRGETRFKRATASAFYRGFNRLSDVKVPLDVGDFRLVDRRALDVVLADAREPPVRPRHVQLDRALPDRRPLHAPGALRRRDEVPAAEDAPVRVERRHQLLVGAAARRAERRLRRLVPRLRRSGSGASS